MTTVIVHPEPVGRLKELITEFLALADKPTDVEFVMWPEPGVRVPEALFDVYAAKRQSKPEAVEEPAEVKPVKRAPGRPRKNVEGQ